MTPARSILFSFITIIAAAMSAWRRHGLPMVAINFQDTVARDVAS